MYLKKTALAAPYKEDDFLLAGRVFSVEEFSTYDGPGIRMTFFLKGCPMRCMWCHNPEGQGFEQELLRSPNGCTGCGACLNEGLRLTGRRCLVPGSVEVCPNRLVRACAVDYTSGEIIDMVRKNAAILNASGGGVTFSGGEPLAQPNFLAECLDRLEGTTNRAIQTSGFCRLEVFGEILERSDYVLYDLKLMDPSAHTHYTGCSNDLILRNYRVLAASGVPFCTRMPLIPGVNDTDENIDATARFMCENGAKEIELLPYNRMAGAKYKLAGREYKPEFDGDRRPEPHMDIFEEYGIGVKIL